MIKKDIEIVSAGHTCLDLIPAFTIDGNVDKMTDVLVPRKILIWAKDSFLTFKFCRSKHQVASC